ncbi:MAG: hypothetical protein ACAH80_05315 [Alphaproteobacteria bacterium]
MPSNAKSLSDIKDQLYTIFNASVDTMNNQYSSGEAREKSRDRIMTLSKDISALEHQIAVQDLLKAVKDEGGSIAFETGTDGATKISVLNPIRLKGSANGP